MKSLLLRELYLGKKGFLSVAAIWFIMFVMGILVRLSMNVGNLALLPEESFIETDRVTYCIFTFLTPLLTMMIGSVTVETAGKDIKSKWMLFQYSSPVKEEKMILAKYIIILGSAASAAVLSAVNGAVIGALSGKPLNRRTVSVMMMISSFILCMIVLILVLTYLFRSLEKAAWSLIPVGLICWFGAVKLITSFSEMEFDEFLDIAENFCVKAVPAAVITDIAVLTVGFFLNVLLLKRRENGRYSMKTDQKNEMTGFLKGR